MSPRRAPRPALAFELLVRPDGVTVWQAHARNNSWYFILPAAGGSEARYASQSGNELLGVCASIDAARARAEAHADRYDTRV